MGVNLSGRQIRVPEKLLHGTKVSAAVKHMGGERVSQLVRRHIEGQPSSSEVGLEQLLNLSWLHPLTFASADQGGIEGSF